MLSDGDKVAVAADLGTGEPGVLLLDDRNAVVVEAKLLDGFAWGMAGDEMAIWGVRTEEQALVLAQPESGYEWRVVRVWGHK